MYSHDIRWRCIALHFIYTTSIDKVSLIMGVSKISIKRWMALFKKTGNVDNKQPRALSSRWPSNVYSFVEEYIQSNPCFYIQELQEALRVAFPDLSNISLPTICRALRHDLKVSRKILEKTARESLPDQLREYFFKLRPFYSYPEQLVFIDETSKDGRDALRRYGWSRVNEPEIVSQPFSRGNRVSVLAAFDTTGFFAWTTTEGTFTRQKFHTGFIDHILPHLNPWPMPRSIVILDNAKIHIYRELEIAIHRSGAIFFFCLLIRLS